MDEFTIFLLFFLLMNLCFANVPNYKLNDGREIPAIALGTYLGYDKNGVVKSTDKQLRDVILQAIDVGYRHFDTASIYSTEEEIGEAIRMKVQEGVVRREDIFITTKLWNTHHRREDVLKALRECLNKFGLEYIDLYLIHWPMGLNEDYTYSDVDYLETWRGLEDAQQLGLVKSIGVSNFNKQQLSRIIREGSVKPAVLQIEIHPQIIQTELVDRNIIPIPKTVKYSRLKENINIFDFQLTQEEILKISNFDDDTRYTLPSFWQTHPYYPFEKVDNPVFNPFRSS